MKDFIDWVNDAIPGFGGYSAFYNLTHPWKPIQECIRQIKWAWQRVFKGYDDRATWSIDSYLSVLISKLVLELKENNIGIPYKMYKGMTPVDECCNYSEEDNKTASDKWQEVLSKISKGFKGYTEIDTADYNSPEEILLEAQFSEGFELFRKHFPDLWD